MTEIWAQVYLAISGCVTVSSPYDLTLPQLPSLPNGKITEVIRVAPDQAQRSLAGHCLIMNSILKMSKPNLSQVKLILPGSPWWLRAETPPFQSKIRRRRQPQAQQDRQGEGCVPRQSPATHIPVCLSPQPLPLLGLHPRVTSSPWL